MAILAAVIAIGSAVSAGPGYGSLQSQVDSTQAEVEGLAAGVESKHGRLIAVAAEARQAAEREAHLSRLVANGRARAARLAERENATERRLDATRERLRRAQRALGARLVSIYKGDTPDFTALLLDAEGFDDLVTRAEYLHQLHDADVRLASRVRELRGQEEVELAKAQRAHDRAEAFADRLELARGRIASVRARAEAEAAALRSAYGSQAGALSGLRDRLGDLTAQLQRAGYSPGGARQEAGRLLGDYAIPESIVACESGGNYGARNPSSGAGGAYQILPSTWKAYGGRGLPHQASKAEQDRIAAKIYADSGGSAWVCG